MKAEKALGGIFFILFGVGKLFLFRDDFNPVFGTDGSDVKDEAREGSFHTAF